MYEGYELARMLKSCLSPTAPQFQPPSLHCLCVRTAAIYATTSLYDYHGKVHNLSAQQFEDPPIPEAMWDEVFPLLDQHFFRLVPSHLYEQFLDHVLCALEVAGHFDQNGKQLMQYIALFFPKHTKRFRAQRYVDRVLMPTILCLNKCHYIEELYLEKADSPAVTTYLLSHVLKFLNNLRVLTLPKQCDDDVASIIGLNCPKLEGIVMTGTNVSNVGLSWLLCCKNLHTIIIPGSGSGITPKGVALLLNGLPGLRHVVYDVMSDVLTYVDFNTSDVVLPRFKLKTILFQSMELLNSNHLGLVTKLCPNVEWLSLDSALFYNLEGLGHLPHLKLLRLNYKSRPLDQTVVDFFSLNCANLTTLNLFEVKDLRLDDLHLTIGQCHTLENLVMNECSVRLDLDWGLASIRRKPLSKTVSFLQLLSIQISPVQLVEFLSLFRNIHVLEFDRCDLDFDQIKAVLREQDFLHTLRCTHWTHASAQNLSVLQLDFRNCKMQLSKQSLQAAERDHKQTMAATMLADYANFSPFYNIETFGN